MSFSGGALARAAIFPNVFCFYQERWRQTEWVDGEMFKFFVAEEVG